MTVSLKVVGVAEGPRRVVWGEEVEKEGEKTFGDGCVKVSSRGCLISQSNYHWLPKGKGET
jgi:hypothetical protein